MGIGNKVTDDMAFIFELDKRVCSGSGFPESTSMLNEWTIEMVDEVFRKLTQLYEL